eukprot:scaffold148_cov144-Isochrysis_galbana.AAC.7
MLPEAAGRSASGMVVRLGLSEGKDCVSLRVDTRVCEDGCACGYGGLAILGRWWGGGEKGFRTERTAHCPSGMARLGGASSITWGRHPPLVQTLLACARGPLFFRPCPAQTDGRPPAHSKRPRHVHPAPPPPAAHTGAAVPLPPPPPRPAGRPAAPQAPASQTPQPRETERAAEPSAPPAPPRAGSGPPEAGRWQARWCRSADCRRAPAALGNRRGGCEGVPNRAAPQSRRRWPSRSARCPARMSRRRVAAPCTPGAARGLPAPPGRL